MAVERAERIAGLIASPLGVIAWYTIARLVGLDGADLTAQQEITVTAAGYGASIGALTRVITPLIRRRTDPDLHRQRTLETRESRIAGAIAYLVTGVFWVVTVVAIDLHDHPLTQPQGVVVYGLPVVLIATTLTPVFMPLARRRRSDGVDPPS